MVRVNKNLHKERINYDKYVLNIEDTADSPFLQFDEWYHEAEDHGGFEANAMVLSTADENGMPSSRVVLLKAYSNDGLVFYSNYASEKGRKMVTNNKVSLLFFYEAFQRQIRINGLVERISEEKSEAYFKTRPKESQFGAMISKQSEMITSKEELERRFEELKKSNIDPVRPKSWGGYLVKPNYFEFWQGRPSRMHDRIFYRKEKETWVKGLLSP